MNDGRETGEEIQNLEKVVNSFPLILNEKSYVYGGGKKINEFKIEEKKLKFCPSHASRTNHVATASGFNSRDHFDGASEQDVEGKIT